MSTNAEGTTIIENAVLKPYKKKRTKMKWRILPIMTVRKRVTFIVLTGLIISGTIISGIIGQDYIKYYWDEGKKKYVKARDVIWSWDNVGMTGIAGSILILALRTVLVRAMSNFQLNKQSRHLRQNAEKHVSELNYLTADKTFKNIQTLLSRRPKVFNIVDHNYITNQESIAYLSGLKGNKREALTGFRGALALRPSIFSNWRFKYRAGLVQNRLLRGICLRDIGLIEDAHDEFFVAHKDFKRLSWTFNILSPARWHYLCDVEKELKIQSALTPETSVSERDVIQPFLNSINIICLCDERISILNEVARHITGNATEEEIQSGKEILWDSESRQSVDDRFRLLINVKALGKVYSSLAIKGLSHGKAEHKEKWLYGALYIYQVVLAGFDEIRNNPIERVPVLLSWNASFRQRYWPPPFLDAGKSITKEILGQHTVRTIVRIAIIRLELHDHISSPTEAKNHASDAYKELEKANKILSQNLHDIDLYNRARVMFYIGAAAKRSYSFDEAKHAFNTAAQCIESIPRTEEKNKLDDFYGIIKKFSGLMHLVFGEFKEADASFTKAHKIYFGTFDAQKQRECGKILDCQGQLLYASGDYMMALLRYESAARYEIAYKSLSQINMAYQLQALNIIKPSKAVKKIIHFIEMRTSMKTEQLNDQIQGNTNTEKPKEELERQREVLKEIDNSISDIKADINSETKKKSITRFQALMKKMNDIEALDYRSVPLLLHISETFSLVADFTKGTQILKDVLDILTKEKYHGVERYELFIDYLVAYARINLHRGLLASASEQLSMISVLIKNLYENYTKYQTVLTTFLLTTANLALMHSLLKESIVNIKDINTKNEAGNKVKEYLLTEPNLTKAWNDLTNAQYYQKIAFAKETYESNLCEESLGKYAFHSKQFDKARDYFTVALNTYKKKLGSDHLLSIRLQNLVDITICC